MQVIGKTQPEIHTYMRTFVSSFNINIKISVNFCACVVWPFRHFVRCVSVSVCLIRWCKISVVCHTVTKNTQKPSQCKNPPGTKTSLENWPKQTMGKESDAQIVFGNLSRFAHCFIFTAFHIYRGKNSTKQKVLPYIIFLCQNCSV